MDEPTYAFHAYGPAHLGVIFLSVTLPFVLAWIVHRTKSRSVEKVIVIALSTLLVLNYIIFMCMVGRFGAVSWKQLLPLQLCDWGMVVVIVAMLSGNQRWF